MYLRKQITFNCNVILYFIFSIHSVRLKDTMPQGEFLMAIRSMPIAYSLFLQVCLYYCYNVKSWVCFLSSLSAYFHPYCDVTKLNFSAILWRSDLIREVSPTVISNWPVKQLAFIRCQKIFNIWSEYLITNPHLYVHINFCHHFVSVVFSCMSQLFNFPEPSFMMLWCFCNSVLSISSLFNHMIS